MESTRKYVVCVCVGWSIVLSFLALILPPLGSIDSSVLILIAQVLLLVASCVRVKLPSIINGTANNSQASPSR